jgi:hypothetical protein
MASDNTAATWFRRVVFLGIAANVALAIPTLFIPERMIALVGLPPATPVLWPQFAAWLLLLLSAMYVPGALDPYGYRHTAVLSVLSRLAGVLFFATQASVYYPLGGLDLVFFVPEAILLRRALKQAPAPQPAATRRAAL